MSSEALVRAYQEDTNRKRILIRRAETARGRLLFVVEAMRRLIADELFQRLLAEEGLVTLPEPLAARIARAKAPNP
jgi:ParB family chromosome partitioning protein